MSWLRTSTAIGAALAIGCGAWDDHPAVIQRACQQMLRTIKVK